MGGFLDGLPDIGFHAKRKEKIPPMPEPANVVVKYIKVKCPKCSSKDTKVYDSNHLPIRYHICNKCGFYFKSVEE